SLMAQSTVPQDSIAQRLPRCRTCKVGNLFGNLCGNLFGNLSGNLLGNLRKAPIWKGLTPTKFCLAIFLAVPAGSRLNACEIDLHGAVVVCPATMTKAERKAID